MNEPVPREGQEEQDVRREISDLVARCVEHWSADGATLEQVCREHPEHAERLRRRLQSLEELGLLQAPGQEFPERLGDFRLERRLGAGGMGVVFLAEQESLGRRVALKLVHPQHLFFPGARERFRHEVETVASLQHPGIAQVHAVGEEQGIPYFAMEYVDGCSLEDVLQSLGSERCERLRGGDLLAAVQRLSGRESTSGATAGLFLGSWVDVCFRLMARVAEALAVAHSSGVVHRDIKPSNILITPEGRLLLVDFGLSTSDKANRMTRSGAFLGSLPYSPPEHVRGTPAGVTPAGDVYALGVTLYELLTLRLPFSAADGPTLARRIEDAQPVAITRLNPAVPWDAETVCMTAMDPSPTRRYVDAGVLAADLEHFLARRPIEARRPGLGLRLLRMAQRHPAAATALVVGFLAVVGGSISWGFLERASRLDLLAEQQETERQRLRAEDYFAAVLDSVDAMIQSFEHVREDASPETLETRERLLGQALEIYEQFVHREGDNPRLVQEKARASERLGDLHRSLGQRDQALVLYDQARALRQELVSRHPQDGEHVLAAARIALGRAEVLNAEGRPAEALAPLRTARSALVAEQTRRPRLPVRLLQVALHRLEGWCLFLLDQPAESEQAFSRAMDLLVEVQSESPEEPTVQAAFVMVAGQWSSMLVGWQRHGEALPLLESALEVQRRRVEADDSRHSRFDLASLLTDLSQLQGRAQDMQRALATNREARDLLQALFEEFPRIPAYRSTLATCWNNRGWLLIESLDHARAETALTAARDLLEPLAAGGAATPEDLAKLGGTLGNLVELMRQTGRSEQGLLVVEEAMERLRASQEQLETDPRSRHFWYELTWMRAAALLDLKLHEEAAALIAERYLAGFESFEEYRRGAVYLDQCAVHAGTDFRLGEAEREELARSYRKELRGQLEEALEDGLVTLADLAGEATLAVLWSRPGLEDFLVEAGADG